MFEGAAEGSLETLSLTGYGKDGCAGYWRGRYSQDDRIHFHCFAATVPADTTNRLGLVLVDLLTIRSCRHDWITAAAADSLVPFRKRAVDRLVRWTRRRCRSNLLWRIAACRTCHIHIVSKQVVGSMAESSSGSDRFSLQHPEPLSLQLLLKFASENPR